MLGISVFINYIDRSNLSIAAPMLKDELGISASQLGILLSAFFWTYACMQPVSGWLVDRLNVNWVIAGGFFLWSAATVGMGAVHAFSTLLGLRLILGLGESVAYPSYSKIIALHFPEEHRGLANSVISAGLLLGPGFGMVMGGMLMARFGWRPFFIALGLFSLLWLVPWIKWMPEARPTIQLDTTGGPSLADFLRLRSAWGTCCGLFCGNYVSYFLITWLPFYLGDTSRWTRWPRSEGRHTCWVPAPPHWPAGFPTAGSAREKPPLGFARHLRLEGWPFLGVSAVSPPASCVVLIWLGVSCLGVTFSNTWAITQTLAGPQAAGWWTGFQNFVGNLAGVVVPALTGLMLDRTGHFYWAFAIVTAVALAGATSWVFLVGPVEQVVWHKLVARAAFAAPQGPSDISLGPS